MVRLSVVVATRDEGARLAATIDALLHDLPSDAEIIVVDDASRDGSSEGLADYDPRVRVHRCAVRRGVAGSRNLGVGLARGGVVLFADAHVQPCTPWAEPILAAVAASRVGAVGVALEDWHAPGCRGYGLRLIDVGTETEWLDRRGFRPYDVPLLPGFFLAVRRSVFRRVGGFDPGMRGWGIEDIEFCVRVWTLGYDCVLLPDVVVRHYSKDAERPDYQRNWGEGLSNIVRFGAMHYGADRWQRLLDYYAGDPALPCAVAAVGMGDAWHRRRVLHAVRARSDEDFFTLCDPVI